MCKMHSIQTPTKNTTNTIRFFYGRMPQLNDVTIFGYFIHLVSTRRCFFNAYPFSVSNNTGTGLSNLTLQKFRSLL